MKKNLLFSLMVLAAGPLLAAEASPKENVTAAATALGGEKNYSWHTTVKVPEDSPFKPGPTDGQTEKDGYTTLAMSFNENNSEAVIKGTNAAIKTDTGWESAAAARANGGGGFSPTTFIARMVQNYKTPAAEAASLAGQAQELKAGTNGISGDLTEAGAKVLLSFRRGGGGGGGGPTITNPKGSVTRKIIHGTRR